MRYLYIVIIAILINSCSHQYYPVYEITTNCQNLSTKQIFNELQKALILHDFEISKLDYDLGLMIAHTEKKYARTSLESYHKEWKFIVKDNRNIVAKARFIETTFNARGITYNEQSKYMGDNTPTNYTWYWDIRTALENLCNSKSTIKTLETDDHEKSFEVWDKK